MGKASVSNIMGPLGLVVLPKAPAIASWSVVGSLFAILALPPSLFCPLAPHCFTPLLGRHPTAPRRLAPYSYSPAGTLLLLLTGWNPLCPVAALASFYSPLTLDLLGYTNPWYCPVSVTAANAFDLLM